jgi:hypothetical protein
MTGVEGRRTIAVVSWQVKLDWIEYRTVAAVT